VKPIGYEIPTLIGALFAAMVLFSIERIPTNLTALGLLLFLVLAGLLPADEAFLGFGSDVVVMMLGLLIWVEGLVHTGITRVLERIIMRYTSAQYNRFLLVVLIVPALVGAFMSNTTATALFLPIVVGVARRAKLSPAKFLMPLAFASIWVSSITLVSTSTNVVVSGLMTEYGLRGLGMFELAPVGIPIAVAGLLYTFLLARYLVPDRIPEEQITDISAHLYLTEIVIPPDSDLVGETLRDTFLIQDLDLKVLRLDRGGEGHRAPTRAHKPTSPGD